MIKTAIVKVSELGTNCWLPKRFIENSSRCCRVWVCAYPEKKTCQAVQAEIKHLEQEQLRLANVIVNIRHTIELLRNMLEK